MILVFASLLLTSSFPMGAVWFRWGWGASRIVLSTGPHGSKHPGLFNPEGLAEGSRRSPGVLRATTSG